MSRHVETIFCDDIRHEIGGKYSYIGVYAEKMFVHQLPSNLLQLCLVVKIKTPAQNQFKKLNLRVLKGDELLAEAGIPDEELALSQPPPENEWPTDSILQQSVMFHFSIAPFMISEPCKIAVRVETEEGEIRGQGLIVETSPQASPRTP